MGGVPGWSGPVGGENHRPWRTGLLPPQANHRMQTMEDPGRVFEYQRLVFEGQVTKVTMEEYYDAHCHSA